MPVTLLGTSHISPKSAKIVRDAVMSGEHDVIAIELDQMRLHQLMQKDRKQASFFTLVKHVGLSGALFARFGHWIEVKLGGRVGTEPGEEMRAAVMAAGERKLPIALIDQPIEHTLRRFSQAFTWRERFRVAKSLFRMKQVKFDLRSAPDAKMVEEMIGELERISPALAKVLIHERNAFMCQRLRALERRRPDARILAIVGAGHVPGMTECLKTSVGLDGHGHDPQDQQGPEPGLK